jgi:hypothetical protein
MELDINSFGKVRCLVSIRNTIYVGSLKNNGNKHLQFQDI